MLLAAGCGAPAAPPTQLVTLSTQNPDANVAPIAEFFRRTCLAALADDRQMNAAISASGWPLRQVHAQDWEGPSIWRFDHGELTWFHNRSMNECFLSLDSLVAPTPAALGTALRPQVRTHGFEDRTERDDEVVLAWPSRDSRRMVLTIYVVPASPGRTYGPGRQAVSLHLDRQPIAATSASRE